MKNMSKRIAAFVAALTFALGLFTGTGLAEATEGCPHHEHTEECIGENGVCTYECELCEQENAVSDIEDITTLPDTAVPGQSEAEDAPQLDAGASSYGDLAQRVLRGDSVVALSENFTAQAMDSWTTFAVPAGQQTVLDLNGQQLASNAQGAAIIVAGEGTSLTVTDSRGGGAITAQSGESIFQVMDGAVLNILDGTYVLEAQQTRAITALGGSVRFGEMNKANLPFITRTQQAVQQPEFGGAILAAGSADVALLGGAISGTTAVNGGAIAVLEDAKLNAAGGAITSSTAEAKGGAVFFASTETDAAQLAAVRFDGNVPSDVDYAVEQPEEPGLGAEETTEEEITDDTDEIAEDADNALPIEIEEEVPADSADTAIVEEELEETQEPGADNASAKGEVSTAQELAQAIAEGAGQVKLMNSIAMSHGEVFPAEDGQQQTLELPFQVPLYLELDLNGHTLTVQGSGQSAFIETTGYFELRDSAGDAEHAGKGGTIAASGVDSILRATGANGKAVLTVGALQIGEGTERGAEVCDGAALILSGTSIEGAGKTAEFGGGVLVDGASMEMTGFPQNGYMFGSIEGTLAENGGGIAVVNGGSLNMSGGRIENSRAVYNGGGIYVDENSTAKVTGKAVVTNNHAATTPANIWFVNGNYSDVETGTGDGSSAAAQLQRQIVDAAESDSSEPVSAEGKIALGTALVVPKGSVTLNVDGIISLGSAAAKESGATAAIRVKTNAALTLTGAGEIRAEDIEAAIAVEAGAELILDGPTVRNMNGTHGISVKNGTLTMKSGTVEGSGQTVSMGGGIFLSGGSHTIAGGTIAGNRAQNGGGIYAVDGAQVAVDEAAAISGNSASRGAGIYTAAGTAAAQTATHVVIDGTVTGNTASDFGGGLYAAAGTGAAIEDADRIFSNTPDQVYAEAGANVAYDAAQTSDLNKAVQDALAAGGTADLSDMPGTIVADETIQIAATQPSSLTLDLEENRTIRWTGQKSQVLENVLFDVQGPVTLTITGSGLIEGGTAAAALVKLSSNTAGTPTLVLQGSTLTNKDGLHAVWSNHANVEVTDGAVISNSGRTSSAAANTAAANTASGSAIYAEGGTVTISGGTIKDNGNPWTANINGSEGNIVGGSKRYGAVYVRNGILNISGGTFAGNQGLQGGAIAADGTALTITGGTFGSLARAHSTGNNASWGGALWVNSNNASITGGTFSGNNASEGGAIYMAGGSLSVSGDTTIEYNSAVMGSKMHNNSGSSANNWRGAGGGIYVARGSLTLDGTAVVAYNSARGEQENNAANWTGCGGGIAVAGTDKSDASLTMKGSSQVRCNTASRLGGGVYSVRSADLQFEGSAKVSSNIAGSNDTKKYHPNIYVRDGVPGAWDAFVSADGAADQAGDSTQFLSKAQDGKIALSSLQPEEGGTYTVDGAVTLTGDLAIDLEGRTLAYEGTAEGESALIVVPDGISLTIENSVGGSNAGISGTDENRLQSLIRLEGTTSKVTLKGGNLTNTIGHAIYAPNGGDVVVDGVEASITNSGSPSAPGGAVRMEGIGTVTVEQGKFFNNRGLLGGAIYSSAVPHNDTANAAANQEESYSLRIHGGVFSNNTAGDGGAVWAQRMWMSGGEISQNRAVWSGGRSGQGGGICITRAEGSRDVNSKVMNLMLTGAAIQGNVAEGVGGGICLSWGTRGEIAGKAVQAVQIQGNRAEAMSTDTAREDSVPHAFAGGGIFIEHRTGAWGTNNRFGSLAIRNLLVTGNNAQYGGGIGLCSDGALEIHGLEGASIHGNTINNTMSDDQLKGTLEAKQAVRDASADILGDTKHDGKAGSLSATMLGSDKAVWTGMKTSKDGEQSAVVNDKDGNATGLYTYGLTNAAVGTLAGDAMATCVISGNESRTGGGGIGGNGGFTAGFESEADKTKHPIPNSPAASASAELAVRKTVQMPESVTNVPMTFTFRLAQIDGPVVNDEMVQAQIPYSELKIDVAAGNGLSSQSAFRGIRFPVDGTYTFQISEDLSAVEDFWSIQGTDAWTVTVTVTGTEAKDQKFAVSYEAAGADKDAEAAEFVNVYTSPDVIRPRVEKTVEDESGSMLKGTFQFELRAKAGTPMPEDAEEDGEDLVAKAVVETDETGAGEGFFGSIRYEEAGAFTYTIRELEDEEAADGMVYDKTAWTLTVEVKDVKGSKVVTSVTYAKQPEAAEEPEDGTEETENGSAETFAATAAGAAAFVNRVPQPEPTPTPTATATPAATPTPTTSTTPGPSSTPSTTPGPSATPTPSTTPGPSSTPTPTGTPAATPTPTAPVQTPGNTPVPSATPSIGIIEDIETVETAEVIVESKPSEEPTSDTMAGEPEWPEEPTSITLTPETEEPSSQPTSDTMPAEPEWPEETESITLGTTEPALEDTDAIYWAPENAETGTISSVGGYTGTPSVVANSDGTIGHVPKTDDAQSLGLWILLALAGAAGSAAGLLGWRRTRSGSEGRKALEK